MKLCAEHKHLILILARGGSTRVPQKNIRPICGRPMLHWTLDVAFNSRVASAVVVSTDCHDVKAVAEEYEGTEVVMRGLVWSNKYFHEVIDRSVTRYMEKTGTGFKFCTVLLGISLFWRPSWIREALAIINSQIASAGEPITHVTPTSKLQNLGMTYRLGSSHAMPYILPHRGINFDIDTPEQFEIACGIMKGIQSGDIPYPLDEDVHTNLDFRVDAERRSHMI